MRDSIHKLWCPTPVSQATSLTHTMFCCLGIETKMHEDDDEEKKSTVKEVDYHAHSKQTKKRLRHVQRQVTLPQYCAMCTAVILKNLNVFEDLIVLNRKAFSCVRMSFAALCCAVLCPALSTSPDLFCCTGGAQLQATQRPPGKGPGEHSLVPRYTAHTRPPGTG